MRPHYSSRCLMSVYAANSPANSMPHQYGTARPESYLGHSGSLLQGGAGVIVGQNLSKQCAALHTANPPAASQQTVLVQAGPQTAGVLIGRGVQAAFPQQGGQRRAGDALGVQ